MSLQRLAILSSLLLGTASAAKGAGGPATVLGFPDIAGPHKDLQILGQSGDTVTYKVDMEPIDGQAETWTVTVSPDRVIGHGELQLAPGMKDTVDKTCALAPGGSVIRNCAFTLGGDGLTPEDKAKIDEENKQPPMTYPTDGPDAYILTALAVGPAAGGAMEGGAAPGAAPGGPGPEPTDNIGIGPRPTGPAGGEGGSPKGAKKPDAQGTSSAAAAGPASSESATTTTKAPKTSGGAPPPATQSSSGGARSGVVATVPLLLLGLAAMLVL